MSFSDCLQREKVAAEDFVSDVELQVMNYGFLVLFLSLHKVAKKALQ